MLTNLEGTRGTAKGDRQPLDAGLKLRSAVLRELITRHRVIDRPPNRVRDLGTLLDVAIKVPVSLLDVRLFTPRPSRGRKAEGVQLNELEV